VVLIFWCLWHGVFFFEKIIFALRKISGYSLFHKLFILFTKISLKFAGVPTVKDTPPKLKASFFAREWPLATKTKASSFILVCVEIWKWHSSS
jgi:hypothetical protein